MARSPKGKGAKPPPPPPGRDNATGTPRPDAVPTPGTTGRTLVLFERDACAEGMRALGQMDGMTVASTADFADGPPQPDDLGGADALVFPDLGVAVVDRPCDHLRRFARTGTSGILAIEAERVVYAINDPIVTGPGQPGVTATLSIPLDYLRGYRDAVNHLFDRLTGEAGSFGEALEAFRETEQTWGLQATKVPASRFGGRGIRVAVLDTGLDLGHPDFAGRAITSRSFVPGEDVQDGHGHGTHCIGTSCGPLLPATPPRYGIAWEAEIFAGKVLSNQGSGGDAGILGGIQWAISNTCAIVSMSLGAPVQVGQPFSQVFEQVAARALAAGTVIIAAAGNESNRPQTIAPVGHPANCPSIMAVAALDRRLGVAPFSCGGLNPNGGQVDIAAPGVDILSSWPRPVLHNTISGTSMATPHVAGIAALWAESDASFRSRALLNILTQSARRLNVPARDIGSGLVQAP